MSFFTDDYVWIGLNGLVNLIDQLVGVDIMVTNPVIGDFHPSDLSSAGDPYAYYRAAVLPGATHLDGVRDSRVRTLASRRPAGRLRPRDKPALDHPRPGNFTDFSHGPLIGRLQPWSQRSHRANTSQQAGQ